MGSLDTETHILTWKVILGQMVEEVMDCIGGWNGERRGSFDTETHIPTWKVILGWMVEEVMDCIGRWNGERSGWMIDRRTI